MQGGTASKVLLQPLLTLSELSGILLRQGAVAESAKVAAAAQQLPRAGSFARAASMRRSSVEPVTPLGSPGGGSRQMSRAGSRRVTEHDGFEDLTQRVSSATASMRRSSIVDMGGPASSPISRLSSRRPNEQDGSLDDLIGGSGGGGMPIPRTASNSSFRRSSMVDASMGSFSSSRLGGMSRRQTEQDGSLDEVLGGGGVLTGMTVPRTSRPVTARRASTETNAFGGPPSMMIRTRANEEVKPNHYTSKSAVFLN